MSDWLDHGGSKKGLLGRVEEARFAASGVSHAKRDPGWILRGKLATLEKLLLLALYHHSRHDGGKKQDIANLTAARAAELCSCHRVTAQRALTSLRRLGVLRRSEDGDVIAWDILAILAAPAGPAQLVR